MSKNINTPVPTSSVDLSVTMRGDITEANLSDYVDAFAESVRGDGRVTYGRTVVYMAARDFGGDSFVAADFAKAVGVSPAYVSTLSGLALAVDRGITPHGSAIMAKRWAALVQNMTKAVRAILRDKKKNLKELDAVLFAVADAKAEKKSTDAKEDRAKRAADKKSGDDVEVEPTITVESAITALDQSAAFLALSVLTPAQAEKVAEILANLSARIPVAA